MTRPYKVYHADPQVRDLGSVARAMVSGLWHSHYAAYRIFIRDLKAEYAQSVSGLLWSFVDPLVVGFIFCLLHQARVINAGELEIPYVVFVVYGALLYQTFAESLFLFMNVLQRSGSLLTQLNLSPEALLLSSLYRCLFNAAPRLVVLLAFSLVFRTSGFPGFTAFLLLFPLILLPGIAVGLVLAPFNVFYHDIGRSAKVIVDMLRYVSPILYPLPKTLPFAVMSVINPVAPILSTLRSLATTSSVEAWNVTLIWSAVLTVVALLGWILFHVSIPIVAERT